MLQSAEGKDEGRAWKVALNYAPVYALGNLCIGTCSLTKNREREG